MKEEFIFLNTEFPWLFSAFSFILGTCFGSFMNVCIYRIPAEKSVVFPGSHCSCGKPIAWYDNIPVLSWFVLRGKARCCGSTFSFRYPFVEFLTGCVFLACWLLLPPVVALCGMIFCFMMICSSFIDIDHMIIPDRFSIGGAIAGVILSFIFPVMHGFTRDPWVIESIRSMLTSMVGVLVGSAFILWIGLLGSVVFRKEAMGMGDVKFLGAIGAFCGWQGSLFAIFGGAVLGLLAMPFIFLVKKSAPSEKSMVKEVQVEVKTTGDTEPEEDPDAGHIPYGPMLAAAGILYFLYFHKILDPYLADIKFMIFHM